MTLIRWEPFREVDSLQQELNQLFNSLTPRIEARANGNAFAPAAEIQETSDAVHLRLEVPGIEPKDLDVQVMAEAVSVTGERKYEKQTAEKGMSRSEFRYGRFQRVIPLPAKVQNDQAQAEYKDGILRLNLPKAEADENKVFKVNLG